MDLESTIRNGLASFNFQLLALSIAGAVGAFWIARGGLQRRAAAEILAGSILVFVGLGYRSGFWWLTLLQDGARPAPLWTLWVAGELAVAGALVVAAPMFRALFGAWWIPALATFAGLIVVAGVPAWWPTF